MSSRSSTNRLAISVDPDWWTKSVSAAVGRTSLVLTLIMSYHLVTTRSCVVHQAD